MLLHFPVPVETLRPFVPDALDVDECDGSGWLTVVPFRMLDVRPRGLPAIPPLSNFAELNLRTYVRIGDFAGVFFLGSPLADFPAASKETREEIDGALQEDQIGVATHQTSSESGKVNSQRNSRLDFGGAESRYP